MYEWILVIFVIAYKVSVVPSTLQGMNYVLHIFTSLVTSVITNPQVTANEHLLRE